MTTKKTTRKKTKEEKGQEIPEEKIEEILKGLKEKRSLFGRLLRIPVDVLYFVIGLIAGVVLGIVSLFFFPIFVPAYMLKARWSE